MANTDKELAQLAAEEKKLLEQQKTERDALKKRLAAVKKQIREEERKLNERRAELLGRCMMQKFQFRPGNEGGHAAGSRWLPVEAGRPGTVRTRLKKNSCHRQFLKLRRGIFRFPDCLPYALAVGVARTLAMAGHRRGKLVFYGLWIRLAGGGDAGRNS